MEFTARRQEALRLLKRPTVVLSAIVGIGVFALIATRAPDRPPLPPPANLATPFPTSTPGASPTFGAAPSPRPPTPTATPDRGGPGRDDRRKADLATIAGLLDQYYVDKGSFPETGQNPQSLCIYENLDVGCRLRKYSATGSLPVDPTGPVGYRYQSDGSTWILLAVLEAPQADDGCMDPRAGRTGDAKNGYCLTGDAPP